MDIIKQLQGRVISMFGGIVLRRWMEIYWQMRCIIHGSGTVHRDIRTANIVFYQVENAIVSIKNFKVDAPLSATYRDFMVSLAPEEEMVPNIIDFSNAWSAELNKEEVDYEGSPMWRPLRAPERRDKYRPHPVDDIASFLVSFGQEEDLVSNSRNLIGHVEELRREIEKKDAATLSRADMKAIDDQVFQLFRTINAELPDNVSEKDAKRCAFSNPTTSVYQL